jgi:hypothetical protein
MTRKSSLTCFLLLCTLCLSVAKTSGQVDRADSQFWSDVQLAIPITKNFDANLLGTLRIGRDFSHPVDERVGVGFTFRFGKYFTVSPNFLAIGMQPVPRRRVWENRLSLPVQLRFNAGDFRLSDRNLFERRLRNSGVKTNRYRNRFQIEHAIGPKDWQLSLFVADEVFYDWAIDRWVRNRFTIGGSKVFDKHFTQDFYYLRQNDGVSIPGDLNVIGTSLRFRL